MTYSSESTFNQAAARSFLEIYGLQAVSDAARQLGDDVRTSSIELERPTGRASLLPSSPTLV